MAISKKAQGIGNTALAALGGAAGAGILSVLMDTLIGEGKVNKARAFIFSLMGGALGGSVQHFWPDIMKYAKGLMKPKGDAPGPLQPAAQKAKDDAEFGEGLGEGVAEEALADLGGGALPSTTTDELGGIANLTPTESPAIESGAGPDLTEGDGTSGAELAEKQKQDRSDSAEYARTGGPAAQEAEATGRAEAKSEADEIAELRRRLDSLEAAKTGGPEAAKAIAKGKSEAAQAKKPATKPQIPDDVTKFEESGGSGPLPKSQTAKGKTNVPKPQVAKGRPHVPGTKGVKSVVEPKPLPDIAKVK